MEPTMGAQNKEELRKKFEDDFKTLCAISAMPKTTQSTLDIIFNRLYSEIEEREKQIEGYHYAHESDKMEVETLEAKISKSHELLRLADQVMKCVLITPIRTEVFRDQYESALEKYNTLKNKAMTNPNAMRTAEEILEQYAGDCITVNGLSSYQFTQAMKAYAKEALELAAKKGKITRETILDWQEIPRKKELASEQNFTQGTDVMYYVDKQSILTIIDQLK